MIWLFGAIALCTAVYVLLIIWFLYGWIKLPEFFPANSAWNTRVTVIIPVRNEERTLPGLLRGLKEQHYRQDLIEVILVDDYSTDRTAEIARSVEGIDLKYISLREKFGPEGHNRINKKRGITLAVEMASGSLIVTTDADCHVNVNWLPTIVSYYEKHNPVMIAGMVSYFYDDTFLGKFQTLDFLSLVGIAAASISNGFYNLCNGANLAYDRAAFLAVDGYAGNDHIPSGDDMMLMHKLAKKYPGRIAYLKNKDSIVYTHAAPDLAHFWQQRMRWTSKSVHYEDKRITLILILVYLFHLSIIADLIAGLFFPVLLKAAMWQFLVKICIDTLFTYSVMRFFRRENLLWLFLPMQMAHILYIICIAPAGVFGTYTWKGRKADISSEQV
ncbi:MAG: glycosyltransferase [Chitinophagales bacterium]